MPLGLNIDRSRLEEICRRYHVAKLELFGSRAKGTARPDSDFDLLVSFENGHTPGWAFVTLAEELEACLGREVDLLVKEDVSRDRNILRKEAIFSRTELVYAA